MTAILISGQLRTLARCLATQRWHVYRRYPHPHFFLVVQRTDDLTGADALIASYGRDRVHIELRDDPDLSADLTPQLTTAYHAAPYANAAPAHQLLLQHWYQREVWRFFLACEPNAEDHFHTVIRMRGDNFFHDFTPPAPVPFFNTVHSPSWGRFAGLNDRFAVMGFEAAAAYFTVYEKIPHLLALGCPFHPETLLRAALEDAHVEVDRTLHAEFSTLRPNGQLRPWLTECLPSEFRPAA